MGDPGPQGDDKEGGREGTEGEGDAGRQGRERLRRNPPCGRMDGGIATAPPDGSAHPPSARPYRQRATEPVDN